ncbi:glycoside hydrolase family 43 protein [Trichoderma sp. SZMC 28013]
MRGNIIFLGIWLTIAGLSRAIHNPIISGWNPDPSILRVQDDYYIATSSFEYFPGIPIYKSRDLSNWTLISHAFTRPDQLQLYGTPTGAGAWAPSLAHFDGKFWIASMTRWTYDPVARVWPRVFFASSVDMVHWSEPTWADPWGIDPELFRDPVSKKTYLNLMAPNNNQDRLWGIYQCEINLKDGSCSGQYRSLWNGTLTHNAAARPEGPKMTYKDGWYYLLIAEGGTDDLHRSTIARSRSPEGPFQAGPNNPLLFNGAYGFDNLTVQSTGHATMVETSSGECVTWKDGWPIFNDGKPILLSEEVGPVTGKRRVPPPFVENFSSQTLDSEWYQLRTPYTRNFKVQKGSIELRPNVFSLSDRDTPAALLRKQKSLNMTFSAELLGFNKTLRLKNQVGISSYLSEFQHQDIGVTGCANTTGLCIYTELWQNQTSQYHQIPLNTTILTEPLVLHIRATPLLYQLGYSLGNALQPNYIAEIASSWQAFAPANFFVFSGASFAIFATGLGEPWPYDGPVVGFKKVTETYYEENIPDHDIWDKEHPVGIYK